MNRDDNISRHDFQGLDPMYQTPPDTETAYQNARNKFDRVLAETKPVNPQRFTAKRVAFAGMAVAASAAIVLTAIALTKPGEVQLKEAGQPTPQPSITQPANDPESTETADTSEPTSTGAATNTGTPTSTATDTGSAPDPGSKPKETTKPSKTTTVSPSVTNQPKSTPKESTDWDKATKPIRTINLPAIGSHSKPPRIVTTKPTLVEPPAANLVKGASWTIEGKNPGTFTPAPLNVSTWGSVPKDAKSVTLAITGSDRSAGDGKLKVTGSGVSVVHEWASRTGSEFKPHMVVRVGLGGADVPEISGTFKGSFTVHVVGYTRGGTSAPLDLRKVAGYKPLLDFNGILCQINPSGTVACDRSVITEKLNPPNDAECKGQYADVVTFGRKGSISFECHGHILAGREARIVVKAGEPVYGPAGLMCQSDATGVTCGYRNSKTTMRIGERQLTEITPDGELITMMD